MSIATSISPRASSPEQHRVKLPVLLACAAALLTFSAGSAQASVAQAPLFVSGGAVPGNLFLVPSVEWPTVESFAAVNVNFNPGREYAGYFDSRKCYTYSFSSNEQERHFVPTHVTTNMRCPGAFWSGNFLNWATTPTIDPFRKALTGGLRVRDTPTTTWLEKARNPGQGGGGIFPQLRLPNSGNNAAVVDDATPFNANFMGMRIRGMNQFMAFRLNGDVTDGTDVASAGAIEFDPSTALVAGQTYIVSVRVAVCVPGLLEPNCVRYSQGWKPEGLLQRYAEDIRFSVFGYLNDTDGSRDGAALRARKKFVGPRKFAGADGFVPNPAREWDPVTGVLVQNPNPEDAATTSTHFNLTGQNAIVRSGVINYINQFGQSYAFNNKSIDPVSEMVYAAYRYFANLGNVPQYTAVPANASLDNRRRWADRFPVITTWEDPIQFWCQKNVFLGIGDANTHRDKNLPGNTTFRSNEPAMPQAVANDTTIDVIALTNRVGFNEELGNTNIGSTDSFSGRSNSAHIAGIAWFMNTADVRPDLPGRIRASLHWVDVLEDQRLQPPQTNQYYLATKWGGMRFPPALGAINPLTFDATAPNAIQESWWHTNGETLRAGIQPNTTGLQFKRPDNYYLGGDAVSMIRSLERAFENIAAELRGATTAVSVASTRLEEGSFIYQAEFETDRWGGDLVARSIQGSDQPIAFRASQQLPSHTARNILTWIPGDGATSFSSGNTELQQRIGDLDLDGNIVTAVPLIDYLRGNRTLEAAPVGTGPLRRRESLIGTIINSQPSLSGARNEGWSRLPGPAGVAYQDYLTFKRDQRRSVVLVGSNAGKLHGFAADNLQELFAFVPSTAHANMKDIANPRFAHRYFVDGDAVVADAFVGGQWRTMAVGTTGAGGRSVFALDIRDPTSVGTQQVRWEFTDPDLGYTIGRPVVTRLQNGSWVAIFGNGYESDNGKAVLFVLDLWTGEVLQRIEVTDPQMAATTQPNGLGTPGLWLDPVERTHASRIYAGDLFGRVWRFDFNSSGVASNPFGNRPLFRSQIAGQRFVTGPAIAAHPEGGLMVYIGSGRFFMEGDNIVPTPPTVESMYALRDYRLSTGANPAPAPIPDNVQLATFDVRPDGDLRRRIHATNSNAGNDGWRIDLANGADARGERILVKPTVIFGRVIFASFLPSGDPCEGGGRNFTFNVEAILPRPGVCTGSNCTGDFSFVLPETGPPQRPPLVFPPDEQLPPGSTPQPGQPGFVHPFDRPATEAWCRNVALLVPQFDPVLGETRMVPQVLGSLCDGRQTWRQELGR